MPHYDNIEMPPNPFIISGQYNFKINSWLLEKLHTMDPISFQGKTAHDYEVFLEDECANHKFDLKPNAVREPYKGHYDKDGMKRYMERGRKRVHPDNFKEFIGGVGEEGLSVSKMVIGTQSGGPNMILDM